MIFLGYTARISGPNLEIDEKRPGEARRKRRVRMECE